jgi:hypothetical protein
LEEEEATRLQKKKAEMLKTSDFDDEVTIGMHYYSELR